MDSTIAIVFATLAGPVLAVWASELRQQRRLLRDRKEWVFRTLWATRSSNMQPEHVQALNTIDIAFPEKNYPKIGDAWHLYFAHLNSEMGDSVESKKRWHEQSVDLLTELIHLMATDLKIPFSKALVKQRSYYPKGYTYVEGQLEEIRTLTIQVLKGEKPFPVHLTERS